MKIFLSFLVILTVTGLVGCPPPIINNSVTIYNNSYEVINAVYISPIYSDSWGANQIYFEVWPGESVTIYDIPDDCYDILVESYSGAYWDIYEVCLLGGDHFDLGLYNKKESVISQTDSKNQVNYQESYSWSESDLKK